jgi:predicted Rossmann fold flavoprotein
MTSPGKITDRPALILGAGAAGLMCAAHAGQGALLVDHMPVPGEKIRISGGGRCNFTNLHTTPENFLSDNPHFAKSALSRYTQWDFIALVDQHGIAWHEKTLGQLFCDDSARQIITLLTDEIARARAELWLNTTVGDITHDGTHFTIALTRDGSLTHIRTPALVVATGGKSIPKIGATGLGYRIADQFGLPVIAPRPALVPLTFGDSFTALSGVAVDARLTANGTAFDEALLFTHRGLSGPAVLQASSYWAEGDDITVTLRPDTDLIAALRSERTRAGRRDVATVLGELIPKRLADYITAASRVTGRLADLSDARLADLGAHLTDWHLRPTGTEGYRKAEVTAGGVDTAALSSRSMESRVRGLYFIGEVVDVTGWLGGGHTHRPGAAKGGLSAPSPCKPARYVAPPQRLKGRQNGGRQHGCEHETHRRHFRARSVRDRQRHDRQGLRRPIRPGARPRFHLQIRP